MDSIGTLLCRARERRDLSKRGAAKAIGVAYDTYDSWERDYRMPRDRDNAELIAAFVDKPTWMILHLAGLLDEKSAAILREHIPGQYNRPGQRPLSVTRQRPVRVAS